MIYGTKTWAAQKSVEGEKLDVSKMRVLRLMCGVTKLERIRIERMLRTRISHMEETNPKDRLNIKEGKHYDDVVIMEKYYCNIVISYNSNI